MEQQFKYFAFISYSSKDTDWGKRLQRKLEHYRMPATLCSEHGWERTEVYPIISTSISLVDSVVHGVYGPDNAILYK